MSDHWRVPTPTQWEIRTYHQHKHKLLEPLDGESIWDELALVFDSRSRAKQVVFFMLYKEESYIRQVLEDHRKEVQYLISRVAAAETERPSQILEEMRAAVYK